jgi:hypothetical protein
MGVSVAVVVFDVQPADEDVGMSLWHRNKRDPAMFPQNTDAVFILLH